MGKYANWVALRWQRKLAIGRALRRILTLLARVRFFAQHVQVYIINNSVAQGASWHQRAQFIVPALRRRSTQQVSIVKSPRIVHIIGSLQPGGAERSRARARSGAAAAQGSSSLSADRVPKRSARNPEAVLKHTAPRCCATTQFISTLRVCPCCASPTFW